MASRRAHDAFLEGHLAELQRGPGVGLVFVGACCEGTWPAAGACLYLGVQACTADVAILVEQIERWRQQDPTVMESAVQLSIDRLGLREPRCEADCGPIPYEDRGRRAPETRTVVQARSVLPCTHDGECVSGGCGNECLFWRETGSGPFGACDRRGELSGAFCGCVGTCAWFE